MKKTVFILLILFITIIGCKKTNKKDTQINTSAIIEIRNQDYEIEFGHEDIEIYFTVDRKKMNGHYKVVDNSVLKEEFYLKKGILHGAHKHYYPNKTLAINTNYRNGKKHGISTSYYKSGELKRKENYRENERVGTSQFFYQDGSVEMNQNNNDDNGSRKMYKNKKLIGEEFEIINEHGSMTVTKIYDELGKTKMTIGFKDNTSEDVLYILSDENKIIDSINPKTHPEKLMAFMAKIGPEFMQ